MNLTQVFLDQLEREAVRTSRALENVPRGKDDWAPWLMCKVEGRMTRRNARISAAPWRTRRACASNGRLRADD